MAERFISPLMYPGFVSSGLGNKLLSWPKTSCVVVVLLAGGITEFPFTHSCAYLTQKNLKGRSLFQASASQGRMEACSFYKLHDNLSA